MNPALAASYAYCSKVARREAKNFYPSFLLLPADRRRSMCALYAFMRRTDDLADADDPAGPTAREAALRAWRRRLDEHLSAGNVGGHGLTAGEWPGWPALADTVSRRSVPPRLLTDVIEGVALDVRPRPLGTYDELDSYCYHVAGAVGLCCIHIWGFRSEGGRAEGLAVATGRALQVTNIVRDVAEDARNGRVYLPREDMERFGVSDTDLKSGRTGEPLRRLLAFEAGRAYDDYRAAEALVGLVDPVGRPVLRALVGIYRSLLDRIARRNYEVLTSRVSVPAYRKAAVVVGALAARFLPDRAPAVDPQRLS